MQKYAMVNNLKMRIQLQQIFGKLLNKDSSLHKVWFQEWLSYKGVRTVFSFTFAINGNSVWKVIFAEDQMTLLQTEKSKQTEG